MIGVVVAIVCRGTFAMSAAGTSLWALMLVLILLLLPASVTFCSSGILQWFVESASCRPFFQQREANREQLLAG